MEFTTEIICIDKNGNENTFKYSLEESEENGKKKWVFRVVPHNLIVQDWFEFSVTEVDENTGKITSMNNRKMTEYIAKGIPEKLIEEANSVLNLTINSSSNTEEFKAFPNEWRSESATKVWERLLNRGEAEYDQQRDIYTSLI